VDQKEYLRILREDVSPEMAASWPEGQRRLVEYLRAGGKVDFRVHDVRSPLAKHGDGSVDAIYLGQCVEHMSERFELPNLLAECYALLKPGGVLRITTPDLDLLLDAYRLGRMHQFADEQPAFYATSKPESQLCYMLFGASGGDCTWDNYEGHFHIYTRGTIAGKLTEAGFTGPYEFERKSDVFAEAVDCGMSHSLAVEAVKK
jgi:predicted SAM-dependent methyltransferase